MHLVLIETSGNQAFIFATNKLRENVGASELTARVGTAFVLDAVREAGGPDLQTESVLKLRRNLRDSACNQPISSSQPVEVILAVSGKALLLVREREIGCRIVSSVTRRALKHAPGLEVSGVISDDFQLGQQTVHQAIGEVHREFEAVRSRLIGPAVRFQRLPIVAECATSGLPAERYDSNGREPGMRSAVVLAKRKAAQGGLNRIREMVREQHAREIRLASSTTDIEDLGCDWLAIVHADGNGLGQVFLDFETKLAQVYPPDSEQDQRNRTYLECLRAFSLGLDECTERAFCRALDGFRAKRGIAPVVPLVLGGDDLTLVCDGRQALQFTNRFINAFEEETLRHADVQSILPEGVTSCAGVAIVKPHFPFFAGYQLAEELLFSAKELSRKDRNRPRSAIDYHILYDASGPDLERIRQELTVGDARLVARPYFVRPEGSPPGRSWSDLERRIDAVRAGDEDGRRRLPNGMLHELREGLFLGRDAAEARFRLVRDRYRPDIDALAAGDHLFWPGVDQQLTGLLDAVDTAEFWEAQP